MAERVDTEAGHRRRLIHDFVEDDRADARAGVGRAQRVRNLRGKMLFADAGNVTAKRDGVLRRAEFKSVKIAGQIGRRIAGDRAFAARAIEVDLRGDALDMTARADVEAAAVDRIGRQEHDVARIVHRPRVGGQGARGVEREARRADHAF